MFLTQFDIKTGEILAERIEVSDVYEILPNQIICPWNNKEEKEQFEWDKNECEWIPIADVKGRVRQVRDEQNLAQRLNNIADNAYSVMKLQSIIDLLDYLPYDDNREKRKSMLRKIIINNASVIDHHLTMVVGDASNS